MVVAGGWQRWFQHLLVAGAQQVAADSTACQLLRRFELVFLEEPGVKDAARGNGNEGYFCPLLNNYTVNKFCTDVAGLLMECFSI